MCEHKGEGVIHAETGGPGRPLGSELPEGMRFLGHEGSAGANWSPGDHPADEDIASCVACGLCLPHCPTYRLTGEESASPRGRVAAMRAVAEGRAPVDDTFASFMDLCLSCRACEDVCPSHVPFGRMMERARTQIEPLRTRRERALRRIGFDVALPHGWMITAATVFMPLVRPFLRKRVRALIPRPRLRDLTRRLPRVTSSVGEPRGTVAVLSGCVQDRWYRPVNRATLRVLARSGWRVVVPRRQVCCGALPAHYGRLRTARTLASENLEAFVGAQWMVVNAAGCGAHMKEYGELLDGPEGTRAAEMATRVRDLMEFLDDQGIEPPPPSPSDSAPPLRVAYHDACHALRAQRIREQPRRLLRQIPGVETVEISNGDRCCGAAGLYNVLEPQMADELMHQKAHAIAATGASVVAAANPGCAMQITAGLKAIGSRVPVVHPVEILDAAYEGRPLPGSAR